MYFIKNDSIRQLPSISMSTFYEFISKTTILEGKLKSTDIDIMFISTCGKDVKYP